MPEGPTSTGRDGDGGAKRSRGVAGRRAGCRGDRFRPRSCPRIEPPKPVPLEPPKPAAKAPDKDTVPLSPFGKSTKKGSENAPVPKVATPAAPATASADEVGVGQTGVTGLEGGDFPYTLYIDRMTTLIGSHWARTQIAGGAKTVVYFEIERDGKIRAAKTEISSGSGLFDRSALGAVLASSPLPPLPFGYSGTYLGVHLTFR